MDIRLMAKKLRNAADALEALLVNELNQNVTTANKILGKRGPYKKRKKLHWTQTKEGKKKLSEAMKNSWSKR